MLGKKIRSCDGCTKCCEGWLSGEAYGHKFWPGMPCHYKTQKGCSIYNNRPENPCKVFQCEWLVNKDIPEWMKPNLINAIITKVEEDNKSYVHIHEAGSKLDSKVLSWFVLEYANKRILNIKYQIDGGWNYIYYDSIQ